MGYAHSRGVIHRDLKPANVMVGEFGEVQVVDWGLAKVLGEPGSGTDAAAGVHTVRSESESPSADSLFGAVMGTLAYMSPEQARGLVDDLDERTDVFALGGILCEVLTGAAPYPGLSRRELHRAALPEQTELRTRLADCGADPELVALARDCMAPEPERRPADARVVAERVAAHLAAVERRARDAQIEVAEARVKAAEERRARRLTLGLAASIVSTLLLGSVSWLWFESDRAGRRREAEERVTSALADAAFARGRERWTDARTALERARAHLESGTSDASLAARVELETTALERAADLARRDEELRAKRAAFLTELETIRQRVGRTNAAKSAAYARTFAAHDVPLEADLDRAADALRATDLPHELARALTDWARLLRDTAGQPTDEGRRLLELAMAVDEDPLRTRARRALAAEDVDELQSIAAQERGRLSPMMAIVIADTLWWLDERPRAFAVLEEAELRHPEDFHLQAKLAARHLAGLDFPAALPYLRAARALQPANSWVLASLAIVDFEAGDDERALARARQAIEADPEDGFAHRQLGILLAAVGQRTEAIEHLRRAVEIDPEDAYGQRRLEALLAE